MRIGCLTIRLTLGAGVALGFSFAQEVVPPPKFMLGPDDERYFAADSGAVYFTSDGTDPQGADGKPAAAAKPAKPATVHVRRLLPEKASFRYLVPTDSRADRRWFSPGFDDSGWKSGTGGVGYDHEDTYVPFINVDLKNAMSGKRASVYLRWKFEISKTLPEGTKIDLKIRCDDGFIAYLNGKRVASQNAPSAGAWRSAATAKVNDGSAAEFSTFQIPHGTELKKGVNVLAIHGLNEEPSSSDFLIQAGLESSTFRKGTEVWHPERPTALAARAFRNGTWSEQVRIPLPARVDTAKLAKDWAQFLGPSRNAVYYGSPLLTRWPDEGPRIVWRKAIGQGYASPVVADGKAIMAHRPGRKFALTCFDAKTGDELWQREFPTTYRNKAGSDHGSRGTPTIFRGNVYFATGDGLLGCVRLEDGSEVWTRWLMKDFETDASWFGFISSPLVTDTAVVYPVGSKDAAIVAFSHADGQVVWTAGSDKISGASPILATFNGRQQLITVGRKVLRGLDPENGDEWWSLPTRRQNSGNVYCAGSVVFGDEMLLSGWYGLGAWRLRMTTGRPDPVWHRDDFLSTHYASAIVRRGYVYGYHGHALEQRGPTLRCVKLSTGQVQWERPKDGSGTVIRAGEHLLILKDTGELVLIKASHQRYEELARAQVTRRTTRSYPAIVGGYVYIKGPRYFVCLDLRAAQ